MSNCSTQKGENMRKTKIFTRISFLFVCLLFLCIATAQANEKKRILIYGDSNTYGYTAHADGTFGRLPIAQTWPGKTALLLGNDYEIIIEGQNGRAIKYDFDDYIANAGLNAAINLPNTLTSHMPLDLVVIMLGTNDQLKDQSRSAQDMANGMEELIQTVKNPQWQRRTNFEIPQVLVLAPPKILIKNEKYKAYYEGSLEKSTQLAQCMQKVAENNHAEFFDAAAVVPFAEAEDEIHLTLKNHSDLAFAVAKKIKAIFKDTSPLQE